MGGGTNFYIWNNSLKYYYISLDEILHGWGGGEALTFILEILPDSLGWSNSSWGNGGG